MSLDSVALVVEVENYFGIKISDSEAERIVTVQDFADCVFSKVSAKPVDDSKAQSSLNKAVIEKAVVEIISDSVGIPINEIKLNHRITDDLGID